MGDQSYYNSDLTTSNKVTTLIGRAIRAGNYLSITYKNQHDQITPFWISILDINENDELLVNMFNVTKEEPILEAKIFISKIQTAEILRFSHYDVSEKLILKIAEDKSLKKYQFDQYDNNLLNYFLACYNANHDPFLHKPHLIPEIDLPQLLKQNPYELNTRQQKSIIKEIYHNDYNIFYQYELVLSEFSIDIESRGKFVVAYRKITFDPVIKTLKTGEDVLFNSNFYINDIKYSLSYYADLSPSEFEKEYKDNRNETIKSLVENFKSGELPNTRPELMVLGYKKIDISSIYESINQQNYKKELDIPLKGLFRNISLHDKANRKEPNIVLYDDNVNVDQLLTIYNALKLPITYIQGPPGTGKTQTILNIVVNCLINYKTLLITSNNNIPIDGIYDKLDLGKYRDKQIMFPIIRLGNEELVVKALSKIKSLYEFETKDVPKEDLLFNLKEKSKENNRKLSEKLKNIELRVDLTQRLEFINGLLAKGSIWLLEQEKKKLEEKISKLPQTNDDNFKGTFEVIQNNRELLQYFYFESLKYIKRLKTKEYKTLIEITYIDDKKKKVKEFNKWISDDDNLELFKNVFPIILTTNISSRKLGQSSKFYLLAMDEAGQCEIATSLIPISKCKNMVLIGDTNQLKPIILVDEGKNEKLKKQFGIESEYDYLTNSILSVYQNIDNISRNILLSHHYRCASKIINYSNMRFYGSKLNLSAVERIGEVKMLSVKNANQKKKNSSLEEALSIINYIQENNLKDVYILTPFRNQEEVINHYLNSAKEKGEIDSSVSCGTIHKVQGQENKTVIISTAISSATSPKTYDWIKNNSQLLNVGVTRAKENLIVVVDKDAIDVLSNKTDDLYALVEYVQKNGKLVIAPSTSNKLTIGFSNNSKFEDEFYITMQHYCTVINGRFRRNIKVLELFPEEKDNDLVNKKEFDGVLYEGKNPTILFEINGKEHDIRDDRKNSDKIKKELAERKGIRLFFIPNLYVKHYEYIGDLINTFSGQKSLFDGYDTSNS